MGRCARFLNNAHRINWYRSNKMYTDTHIFSIKIHYQIYLSNQGQWNSIAITVPAITSHFARISYFCFSFYDGDFYCECICMWMCFKSDKFKMRHTMCYSKTVDLKKNAHTNENSTCTHNHSYELKNTIN